LDFEEIKYEMQKKELWKPVIIVGIIIVFTNLPLKPWAQVGLVSEELYLIFGAVENTV